MQRLYLDTHIFVYLTEEAEKLSGVATRLKLLVRTRVIEIFGSLELLGEFVPRATFDSTGFRRLVDFFWTVCGNRILRTWNELIREKIRKGARLSLPESTLELAIISSARYWPFLPAR